MVECGPFARMAALFLAREAQEAGDAGGELHWRRVAQAIVEMEGEPARPDARTLH